MTNSVSTVFFGVGLFFAGLVVGAFPPLIKANSYYQKGRESVLSYEVVVGGDPIAPCAVKIPLSVLAEMVNSGVMLWHERCEQEASQ